MLGAVVAYRRDEHIRLSAVLRRSSPRVRAVLETIVPVITAIFVIELIPASIAFFKQEQIDLTPAMGVPQSYVVLAIIVIVILAVAL